MWHVDIRPATFVPIFKLLIFNTYVYGHINRCKFIRRSLHGSRPACQAITRDFRALITIRQPVMEQGRVKVPRRSLDTYIKGITMPSW